ncbi:MAG: hypothetical protein HY537_13665 [Deltaproteobacteria bacterium]|nr:hypothetical protein [Deltaproteobacteria bacterium]
MNRISVDFAKRLMGNTATGLGTEKTVEQFIVHPNILKTLQVGECVFITKYPKSQTFVVKVQPAPKERLENGAVYSELLKKINSCNESSGTTLKPLDLQHGMPLIPPPPPQQAANKSGFWSDDSNDIF